LIRYITGSTLARLVAVEIDPLVVANVPLVGNVTLVGPDVVNVRAFAPTIVIDEPATPRLIMLLPLLSIPFLATKRRLVVVMIHFPH